MIDIYVVLPALPFTLKGFDLYLIFGCVGCPSYRLTARGSAHCRVHWYRR